MRKGATMLSTGLTAVMSIGVAFAAPPVQQTLSSLGLAGPFGAPTGWRFTAEQGPPIADPIGEPTDRAPGVIRLCISPGSGRTCRPSLDRLLASRDKDDLFAQPHFLNDARVVFPRAALPVLLIQVASLHSGDGDQRVATTALVYERSRNALVQVYSQQTGRNNNQEIRYVETGPLRGAIVSAEPTRDAPFAFWMTINRMGPDNRYRQVLRYRSATRYNDGNALAVIDSEMPQIQRRLGLWHPGSKLPLPAGLCPQPRLIAQELWCSAKPAT